MFPLRLRERVVCFCKGECGINGGFGLVFVENEMDKVLRSFWVLQRSLEGEENFG